MKDVGNCKFENGIVPYMYGELPAHEASEFESHLLECGACTDEFAAVSAARYEVYEWKKLEFEPLATPVFEIPQHEHGGISWFDKLRAAFASSWAIPGFAFAGLALVVAFTTLFVLSRDDNRNVAKVNTDRPETNRTIVAAEANPSPVMVTPQSDAENVVAPRPTIIPVSEHKQSPSQTRRPARVDRPVSPRIVLVPETVVNKTPKAPTLNNFDDEEDTSLRLAELFDDIETRDLRED